MPQQGTFAAYKEAYADKPIDVAGGIAETSQAVVDVYTEEEKAKKAKTEKYEKLYGNKVAKIIDTQDAPPGAQEISVTAGDEIYDLIKNSGLEGLDLERAINNVIKDANHAISGITGAAKAKVDQPTDAFFKDSGFGLDNDTMLNGDYAFQYKNGRGYFLGPDGPVSVSDFNRLRGKTVDVPKLSLTGATEALDGLRKSNEWNLNKPSGQAAYKTAANQQANQLFNEDNALAAIRFLYNRATEYEIPTKDKQTLLNIGAKLQNGASFNELESAEREFYAKYKEIGIESITNSLSQNLPDLSKDPKSGSGSGSGSGAIDYTNPKAYTESTSRILYGKNGKGAARTLADSEKGATNIVKKLGDKSGASTFLDEDENYTVTINHSGDDDYIPFNEDASVGVLTIKDVDGAEVAKIEYDESDPEKTKEKMLGKFLYDSQSQEKRDTLERFAPTATNGPKAALVEGNNYGTISTDLDIFYRNQGIDAHPTKTGITLKKGTKSLAINLEGLSGEDRAVAIAVAAEQL